MKPYYADGSVQLYHGDMREVVPLLDVSADCVLTDPPYGETSLAWDRWPDGWPDALLEASRSMWCFGSLRMFLDRVADFGAWRMSQDVVWEKHNGSGLRADRFRRTHETAIHWYQGAWGTLYKYPQRVTTGLPKIANRSGIGRRPAHFEYEGRPPLNPQGWVDDGTRLMTSVLHVRSMHGRASHPTEKPLGILGPLIEYACPPGGTVLDPFAGSGSTAVAARLTGRRAVLIEADERYCEAIARRLAQDVLPIGGPP